MIRQTKKMKHAEAKAAKKPAGAAGRSEKRKAVVPVAAPEPELAATLARIAGELSSLRALVEKAMPRPIPADAALEGSVDAVRRVLSDLMEARIESVLGRMVGIRGQCAASGVASALTAIDALIADLGGLRFDALRLDYPDPLIHKIVGERREASEPDGVVLETLQPGFRTAHGTVLAKAGVVVNRRA